jgi:ribonuclease P protein component
MLPKKYRIPKERFSYVFGHGKRRYTNFLQCIEMFNDDINNPRLAVIVGKKVSKSAVKRNRMKRIIQAAFSQLLPKLKQTTDFIIMPKKDCSKQKIQDIVKDLKFLL